MKLTHEQIDALAIEHSEWTPQGMAIVDTHRHAFARAIEAAATAPVIADTAGAKPVMWHVAADSDSEGFLVYSEREARDCEQDGCDVTPLAPVPPAPSSDTAGAKPLSAEQERERFELAWRAEYPMHSRNCFMRSHFVPDGYVNTRVNDGWLMWQARAALASPAIDAAPEKAQAVALSAENEREAFEAWAEKKDFGKHDHAAWSAWQARAALPLSASITIHQTSRHGHTWNDVTPLDYEMSSADKKRIVYACHIADTAGPRSGASDFDKQVARLTFLLRTELKKLDDETLAQLDLVERSLERRRIDAKGASEARDIALSELYDMVYEECYFMDFRKRVIELLAQGVLK